MNNTGQNDIHLLCQSKMDWLYQLLGMWCSLNSWEELHKNSPGALMDQVRCPVMIPSMASIHHTAIWAELDPTHCFLLNRPHYPVSLNTYSRIIFVVFPRPLNDFVDWQSGLDLPRSDMEDILSSMFVPDHIIIRVLNLKFLKFAPG